MERAPVPAEELDVLPTASEDGSESEPDSASDSGWGTDAGTASDGVGESDTDTDAHHNGRCDSDGEGAEADGELLARTTASGCRSRIKDYSLASPLERLAAAVEVTLRKWAAEDSHGAAAGSDSQPGASSTSPAEGNEADAGVVRTQTLDFDGRTLELRMHPRHAGEDAEGGYERAWGRAARHRAVRWFGLEGEPFVELAPRSFSGSVMNSGTASSLLSAGALALASLAPANPRASRWPLLVPVHEPMRGAYVGCAAEDGVLVRFEADLLSTNAPTSLGHLDGLVATFASKVSEAVPCPDAAADVADSVRASLCYTLRSSALHPRSANTASTSQADIRAAALAKLQLAAAGGGGDHSRESHDEDATSDGSDSNDGGGDGGRGAWDADQPWSEWAAFSEPMACLELRCSWDGVRCVGADGLSDNPVYSDLRPLGAHSWALRQLEIHPADDLAAEAARGFGGADGFAQDGSDQQVAGEGGRCFATLLRTAARSMLLASAARVTCVEQLAAGEAPVFGDSAASEALRSMPVPPPIVLERVVAGMFQAASCWRPQVSRTGADEMGDAGLSSRRRQDRLACAMKGAPAGSLTSLLALHSLEFSNARAVAVLWNRVARELRLLWEHRMLLPGVPDDGSAPDMAHSLLHQKLCMLNTCIVRSGQSRSYSHASLAARSTRRAGSSERQRTALSVGAGAIATTGMSDGNRDGWDVEEDLTLEGCGGSGGSGEGAHWAADDAANADYIRSASYVQPARVLEAEKETGGMVAPGDAFTDSTDEGDGWDGGDDIDIEFAKVLGETRAGMSAGAVDRRSDSTAQSLPSPTCRGAPDESFGYDTADDDQDAANAHAANGAAGVDGIVPELFLLSSGAPMMRPVLQPPALLTEDELCRRQQALRALGDGEDTKDARARLQSEELVSAMAAFKAANPGCAFEDFVRFDSPNDWIDAGPSESSGGRLSERMARAGNLWRSLWDETPALPALEQRPLFNAEAEAEKVLHWFDTATPLAALSELLSAGAAAAAQMLAASPAAALPSSERALDRLVTQASSFGYSLMTAEPSVLSGANALGDASIAGATSRAEEMLAAFAPAERSVLEAAWLSQRLPPTSAPLAPLLHQLLEAGQASVSDPAQREALACLFVSESAAGAGNLAWCGACDEREFVLRADAGSEGGPRLAQRMYASYSGESCRMALALRAPAA